MDFHGSPRARSPAGVKVRLPEEARPSFGPEGGVADMASQIDVTKLIDAQPVSRFLIGVVVLCALVTLADGYNITVIALAAPALRKAWHLEPTALAALLSSSLVAGLVGPFLFGLLSDRIGRRQAMIAATLLLGGFGIASGLCTSVSALVIMRFIAGVGMSGALAVTVAAANEFAPRRLRATIVTIVFSGTTIGSGLPGLVAGPLLARYPWPVLFYIGGVAPILLVPFIFRFLPESPKFLCLHPGRHEELGRLLRRFDPRLQVTAQTRFTLGEASAGGFPLAQLFVGRLALLTPLLWLGSFLAQTVFFSFNNGLPILLTDAGVPFARASLALAVFQFAGTLGGWSIMRPVDRFGMLPCTILYVLGVPLVASLGLPGSTGTPLMLLCAAAGFCVLGLHFAQVACVSNIYPTAVRGFGVGWFMLFARTGGAIGPMVVGVLVGWHVSMRSLFALLAAPLVVGIVASIAVTLIYHAHYQRAPQTLPAPSGAGQEVQSETAI